jgi:hypothetical protein
VVTPPLQNQVCMLSGASSPSAGPLPKFCCYISLSVPSPVLVGARLSKHLSPTKTTLATFWTLPSQAFSAAQTQMLLSTAKSDLHGGTSH